MRLSQVLQASAVGRNCSNEILDDGPLTSEQISFLVTKCEQGIGFGGNAQLTGDSDDLTLPRLRTGIRMVTVSRDPAFFA